MSHKTCRRKLANIRDQNLNRICRSSPIGFRLKRCTITDRVTDSDSFCQDLMLCVYSDIDAICCVSCASCVPNAYFCITCLSTLQEAAHQERQAAQKAAAERRARVAEVEKQRKHQTTLLRKKTKTGQPVMRHRIDKILDALQA